jgi:archaellum component FlaC
LTIDERLERLTERHEALTQTVELLTRDVEALRIIAAQDGENIRALARIAELHHQRLERLEGGRQ